MKSKQSIYLITVALVIFLSGCSKTEVRDKEKATPVDINLSIDSLPTVFTANHADIIAARLKNEAFQRFIRLQLPASGQEWGSFRDQIKNKIIEKAHITIDHKLPLNVVVSDSVKMNGYTMKNIIFQTLPGVYATASLYIPDGKGPFPAVINMNGHWREARLSVAVQSVAITLALHGYICLSIDAFGAGERSIGHGTLDYHGANMGASLMNVGKTLLGIQVSENIRGIDLLSSLPNADPEQIGATGASGGGNQTMWLTAVDDRVKAAVAVVSVGTFESYIMGSNCVCELLPDGLTLTEESGILSIIAPRAILMCNHSLDLSPTFIPREMLRTYHNARPVFEMLGVKDNIGYRIFNLVHDYASEDREAMLGWFDLHLKGTGNGDAVKEIPFKTRAPEDIMAYPADKRDPKIKDMEEFLRQEGDKLNKEFVTTKSFDISRKKNELREILRLKEKPVLKETQELSGQGGWERFILEISDGRLIPVLHLAPRDKSKGYTILCDPGGKANIPPALIDQLYSQGHGIVLPDLSGTGENASSMADTLDKGVVNFHTLSRADLWMGRTILGDWVNELEVVCQFLNSRYHPSVIEINGSREAGLAALFYTATEENNITRLTLREAPLSYRFDSREGINFFTMAVHLPGILMWGDISLLAALSGKDITFNNPVTMSGNKISSEKMKEYRIEFDHVRQISGKKGKIVFN